MESMHFVARAARNSVDELYAALDEAPGGYRSDHIIKVATLFRMLGVAEFLIDKDVDNLHYYQRYGVQASLDFLQHASPDDVTFPVLAGAFFDAACMDDRDALAGIARLAPRQAHPREDEGDWLYLRIAMDAVGLGRPPGDLRPLLERLREIAPGSHRCATVDGFLMRDGKGMSDALEAMCRQHEAQAGADGVDFFTSPATVIFGRMAPLEAVAWLKLAQAAGIEGLTSGQVPRELRGPCKEPVPPPGAWREWAHPAYPRAGRPKPVVETD